MENVTFILHKPSKPSLYMFLWLLLDLEARSSQLGVLGLWFTFLKPLSVLGPALLGYKHYPSSLCFTSRGGLEAHSLCSFWVEVNWKVFCRSTSGC